DLAGPLGTAVADTSAAYPWLLTPAAVLFAALVGWLLSRPLNALLSWCFQGFNAGFGHATKAYTGGVGKLLHFSVVVLVIYGGLMPLTAFGFVTTPKGFIPNQDMGYLMVNVQLDDSASMERTRKVMLELDRIARKHPGIKHATAIGGQSFALSAYGS